jgi:hypothetical protein
MEERRRWPRSGHGQDCRHCTRFSNFLEYGTLTFNLLSCDVHMINSSNFEGLLVQQLQSDVLIEVLDITVPILAIQGFAHYLPLLCM